MKKLTGTIGIVCILFSLYGCATVKLEAKFTPLRSLIPMATIKQPGDVTIVPGMPLEHRKYIELGYVKVDESWTSPIVTEGLTEQGIELMVRKKAAEYGADAVIKYNLTGRHGSRLAEGLAIKYEESGKNTK
jgi:hypothetical protein